MKKKNKKIVIFLLSIFLLTLVLACSGLYICTLSPKILDIDLNEDLNEDYTVTLNVKFRSNSKENYCLISENSELTDLEDINWIKSNGKKCSFNVNAGNYFIYIKDKNGGISSYQNQNIKINKILSLSTDVNEIYVALDGTYKLDVKLITLGEVDETLIFESSDESILNVNDGVITPVSVGDSTVKIVASDGKSTEVVVHITDLIHAPIIEEKKQKLKCKQYTEEEAHKLDDILANRVSNAGEGTRAAVVAAARFLALEFPYRIEYFFENGRLNNYGNKSHVDGEGRYFHKGLYLSTDKFKDIEASKSGPAIWGCPLTNWQEESYYKPGVKYPNGLDCSGFVTWTLKNAGMNIKDSGAGASPYRDDDMDDLGEKVSMSKELMESHKIKAGDLIGRDGHIAIVLGINDKNIYVVESLIGGVKVVTRDYESVLHDYNYKYVMLMDSEYSSDGNGFSNMWE